MNPERLLIVAGEKTRLRTSKNSAVVHLDLLDAKGKRHKGWVAFTAVADVALLAHFPKRSR